MVFKIKFKKFLGRPNSWQALKISKILSDVKGVANEERAFYIIENYLRIFIRERSKNGKKKENIEFSAQRYGNDPGRDICLILLYPVDLRGEKINIEIKSSKKGTREHRLKGERQLPYKTKTVIVNEKRSDKAIARSVFAIIEEEIKIIRKENKNKEAS